jgi:polysaccharide export outer membrane protein
MMALLRLLAPALAAAVVAACGVSSVGDSSGGLPRLATPAQPQAPGAADALAKARDPEDALRKVSLSYTALSDPKNKAYRIGPMDVLEVTVFKAPELSKTLQVSEAGTVNFPLVGEIEAGGKSARELEQLLTKMLGAKYLQNPQISVFVKEHNSQRVTVEGAVKKPGVIPITGGMSLLQAVAQAGGLEDIAESTAVVFRVTDGKRFAGRYDVADIRAGRADDPPLQSGDVIVVPTSDLKQGFNTFLKIVPLATLVPLL